MSALKKKNVTEKLADKLGVPEDKKEIVAESLMRMKKEAIQVLCEKFGVVEE